MIVVKFNKDGYEFVREMPEIPRSGDRITTERPEGSTTVIVHYVEWCLSETSTTIIVHCVDSTGAPVAPMRFTRDEQPCGICKLPKSEHIAPEGLYMGAGTPFIPTINNCAVENGYDSATCPMCAGNCPGRHAWVP